VRVCVSRIIMPAARSLAIRSNTATHMSLLDLPRELRDQIYELVLGDLVSNPLYIRKFDGDPHWKVCYNPDAGVHGILLTSRLVYSEAKKYLYKSCNPPRIVIHHWYSALHAQIMSPEAIGARRGFKVRDLETILPILNTVEELNLTVEADGEERYCYLLLSWMRSVLNQREIPLRKANIAVYNNPDRGTISQAERIRALNHPHGEIWSLQHARRDDAQGPPRGFPYRDTYMVSSGCVIYPSRNRPRIPDHLPQSMAWRNLIYGETHYWAGTKIDETKIMMDPKRRWIVALLVLLCDLLDMIWFHDLLLGPTAGICVCCPICSIIHIGSLFDSRVGNLGWQSTRAHIAEREADRCKAVQRRLHGDTGDRTSAKTYPKFSFSTVFS
jgi:hypothetical protein